MPTTNLIDVSESAVEELINLDYIKRYSSIDTDMHDILLESLLKSAIKEIETFAGISITKKTIRAEWSEAYTYVNLPKPIINEIVTVKDGEDNALTLNTNYKVRGQDKKRIYGDFSNGLVVTYNAGYGVDCPDDLKLAIVKNVADNFEQRTGIVFNNSNLLPNSWHTIAIKYRPTWVMF